MGFGSTGKILRIDLSSGSFAVEEFDEQFFRKYPGGKAFAAYFLLKECPQGVDPFSPENLLILATGALTGAPVATATRYTAAARSPLTGAYGESEAGGFWGPELKFAGFDAIIIKGKSPKPVYIWIKDGNVQIRSADHLWGNEPYEVQETIRKELGDNLIRVLQIGPAGERLVRYAAITNELRHFNGRNGIGAVMGSKNLRAIAVRGKTRFSELAAEPQKLVKLGQQLAKEAKNHPQSMELTEKGTPGLVTGLNAGGILPTLNFNGGSFDGAGNINWDAYQSILNSRRSCYACVIHCKREVEVSDRYEVSTKYGGPEYETIAAFGSNCGVSDLQAVAKANELCNLYLMDTISVGSAISFAMECFENGLIGLDDTGGIPLTFGNVDAMLQMVELIGKREGFGYLLGEGVLRAARALGRCTEKYAMHVKGQELPFHDPRGKASLSLAYAIAENGADHLTSIHDPALANPDSISFKGAIGWGTVEPIPARELSARKARQYLLFEHWSSFIKVVGLCYFGPAPRSFIQVDELIEAMRAVTGWEVTVEEMLEMGERSINLSRLFNQREGFSRNDDNLPDRLFHGLTSGPLSGVAIDPQVFAQVMTELYLMKGWNPQTGMPTRQKLMELGLEWAADLVGVV